MKLVTRTLDEIATDLQDAIFLKIDVQGAELAVLEGGAKILMRCDLGQAGGIPGGEHSQVSGHRGAGDGERGQESKDEAGSAIFSMPCV